MRYRSQIDLFALTLEGGGDRPAEIRIPLLPHGTYEHEWYGLLKWSDEKFAEMVANFERGATGFQPMLNFDHASHNPFAAQAPAAGWFTRLEAAPGEGLFARVELTPRGEAAIRNREYRYISAEVADAYSNSQGDTFANVIIGAALTNTPFHDSMPGLFGQNPAPAHLFSAVGPHTFWAATDPKEGSTMPTLLERVRALLGLSATASEAEAVAALDLRAPAIQAPPAPASPAPAPVAVTEGTFSVPPGQVLLSQEEVTRLRQAEADLRAERETARQSAAAALVERFIGLGRLLPAQREAALVFAAQDPDGFARLYEAAPEAVNLRPVGRNAGPGEGGTGADTFAALVDQTLAREQCDYATAARLAAQERPDLYEAYRQGRTR